MALPRAPRRGFALSQRAFGRIGSVAVVAFFVLPLAVGTAAAGEPISYGKVVEPGILGVPFADSTDPNFPYSHPTFGSGALADGQFVYDTEVGFEIVDPTSNPVELEVTTEIYTPGYQTIYENVTTGPNTTSIIPVKVPAKLDPTFANGTVFAAPGSSGSVEIPLATTNFPRSLEVTVGQASWNLTFQTPATSVVSGIFTGGGLWTFAAGIAGITLVLIIAALAMARRLVLSVGRTPPVPRWWPIAWISAPVVVFSLGFVPFSQTLGATSPFVLPIPFVVAAFPYLGRLFTPSDFRMMELEGLDAQSTTDGRNAKAVMPMVRRAGGWQCCPETWWEAFLSHWAGGLPRVNGWATMLMDRKVEIQPRPMDVVDALESGYYRSDATASCWFAAGSKLRRERHQLRWWKSAPTVAPSPANTDGKDEPEVQAPTPPRRRLSPHVVPGYLAGVFPPKLPVAETLAGVRNTESLAHDKEVAEVAYADVLGSLKRSVTEESAAKMRSFYQAWRNLTSPRGREELERQVAAASKTRGTKTDAQPEPG